MKKLIGIILCLAVVAGVGIVIYEKTGGSRVEIEDILPQNVSFYVQLRDVEKNLKEFSSMPVWRGISNIDYEVLMKEINMGSQQAIIINLVKTQLMEALNNPLAKRLFGNDVALAIYPFEKDISMLPSAAEALSPAFIEEVLSGLFLVTRVDPDVQFAEFITRFFKQFGSNVSQGQVEYRGEIVRTVTISNVGIKVGMVRLNDLIVIGIGEKAARLSVDIFKGHEPSLSKDPQFAKIRNNFLKPSSVVGYLNFVKFMSEFKHQGDKLVSLGEKTSGNTNLQDQWEKALARMAGLKAFAFSSQLTPNIRIDSRLMFDSNDLDAEYSYIYTCSPSENKTINFTPQKVLGYHWNNCLKLDHYWEQIKKELAKTEDATSKINDFEVGLGLSVEGDILPAIGDEIGGYIQDIQIGGLFPIPKILFFVEVASRSKAEGLLKKLEEQPYIMLQDEDYNGTSIKYIALPVGQDVQPGYAFLGNYLLISTSRNLIKESIDVSRNAALSLKSDPDFKEIDFGLSGKNRSVQFLKVGQVIEKVKGIIGWSNQWMATKDRKAEAFKTGSAKPLEEVKASIVLKESELDEIREHLILVEDEIWNMESKGLDISTKQAELNELQDQLASKKEEIIVENERKEGLVNIVGKVEKKSPDSETRKFYLEKVVYPVLDSLKSIKSFGLRTTVSDDAFESSVFLKVTN